VLSSDPGDTAQPPTAQPSATPGWLLHQEPGLCPCGCIGTRRKGSFIDKTLNGGAGVLRQAMFSNEMAERDGLLQRFDPRAKLVGTLLLLLAASLLHSVAALAVLYALTLVLAGASAIPVLGFVKRVWLFVPVFTMVVVLPATLSVVTPGDVILPLWTWNGEIEGVTRQGLASALLLVSRVAVSVSLAVLLTLSTPWNQLLAALRSIRMPRFFVMTIAMAYRYIFVLLGSVTDMYEARKARTLGKQAHDRSARDFAAASAGVLFGRAAHMSEEVHQAMVARGYRGEVVTLLPFRMRPGDWVLLAAAVLIALAVFLGSSGLGR
jgi:cobalt/nickel transport system permease protein